MHTLPVSIDEPAQLTSLRINKLGLVVLWLAGFVHSLVYWICVARSAPYKDIAPILRLVSAASKKCINSEQKNINGRRRVSMKRRGAGYEFNINKNELQ